ncbi:MAG: response regulator transcription factor [Coriobacteriia bacterium]
MKILLADDETAIRELLGLIIRESGYQCCEASNGAEAIEVFDREHPDLVILDVMMPKMNGFEVCEYIRSVNPDIPVLFLSAKGDIVDKKSGFRAGCDDYVTKPFNEEEIVLRIEALLRRCRQSRSKPEWDGGQIANVGDFEFDQQRNKLAIKGKDVALTPKEFQILALLASNEHEVYSKEELIEFIWGKEYVQESVSIPVYVRRIREKIEEDSSKPQHLCTVWGVGYYFVA